MVKKQWLNQKLKRSNQRKQWLKSLMEKNKDVQVFVTGVSMTGESELNEHNRTPKENKEQSEGEEICNSREDD
jgi:hypothetical protein